ncbi:hypothetical protein ACIQB5_48175 [Streptomyces sp. NPDC088560]|uniref:hypothetical protein n=1 Tax=Streptomyces sp. NPDC088560 TaxID=3365868 RepID=UPI0037F56A08
MLGSILTTRIGHYARETITQLGSQDRAAAAKASGSGELPDLVLLPAPVRTWLEGAYGHVVGEIFRYLTPGALIAFLVTLFIKEVPLHASSGLDQAAQAVQALGRRGWHGAPRLSTGRLCRRRRSPRTRRLPHGRRARHRAGRLPDPLRPEATAAFQAVYTCPTAHPPASSPS